MTNKNENVLRIDFVDQLKGLAILLVVMGHIYIYKITDKPLITGIIYTFHMPLFMILAGYVSTKPIENSIHSKISFIKKKFRNLMVPYLSFSIIYGLILAGPHSIIMMQYKAPFWFLLILFILHLVKLIINKYIDNNLIFIGYIALSIGVLYILAILFPTISSISRLWYYLIWFYIGYIIRKYKWMDNAVRNNPAVMIAAFLIYLMISLIVYFNAFVVFNSDIRNLFTGITASVVLIYLFNLPIKFSIGIKKILSYLGKKSLDIYVIHYFFLIPFPGLNGTLIDHGSFLLTTSFSFLVSVLIILACLFTSSVLRLNKYVSLVMFGEKI